MKMKLLVLLSLFAMACRKEGVPPVPPENLNAIATSRTESYLTWSKQSEKAKGFLIKRKTNVDSYKEIARVGINASEYKDTGLQKNTTYTYQVFSYNDAGISVAGTNESSCTTFDDPPVAPGPLTVSVISPKGLKLNWLDNSNNETGFLIERRSDSGVYKQIASLAANTTVFTDSPLITNKLYYYRVKSVDKQSLGNYSNEASGRPVYTISSLTWSKVSSGMSVKITTNADSSVLMLARQSDVLKSVSGGNSWAATNFPAGFLNDYGSGFSGFLGGQWIFGTNGQGWLTTSDGGASYSNNGPGGVGCGSFFVQGLPDGSFISSKTGFLRGIYKSSGPDNATWTNKYPGVDPRGIAVTNNGIYIAAGGTTVLKSVNNGETWSSISAFSVVNDVTSIGDTLYWADNASNLFKSQMNNLSTGVIVKNFGEAFNAMWPRLVYDQTTDLMVVASPTKGLFISKDMGQNWVNYLMPGAGYYYTATIIKKRVFVCTDIGVFVSDL